MSGYTKGPWEVRTLENFGFNVVHYVDGDRFNIQRIAKVGEEANARMIAAAPDMFEALVQLERWFDTDEEILAAMNADTRADHERKHNMIRAAIAKAKGGAA